jgi:hypothetical protein
MVLRFVVVRSGAGVDQSVDGKASSSANTKPLSACLNFDVTTLGPEWALLFRLKKFTDRFSFVVFYIIYRTGAENLDYLAIRLYFWATEMMRG